MQINRWLYLQEIPLRCDLFWKRIDQQNSIFIETNNSIVLAVPWPVKNVFAPDSLIFQIRLAESQQQQQQKHRQLQSVLYFTETQKCIDV